MPTPMALSAFTFCIKYSSASAAVYLPDALHIPLSQIKDRADELAKYASRPVIVYCARGVRSSGAASALAKLGFARVLELRGGLQAWVDAGLPTRRD